MKYEGDLSKLKHLTNPVAIGTKCVVLSDSDNFFNPGEIVTTIDGSALPDCKNELGNTNPMRLSELAMSPSDHQEPPPPKQPLFTPTERRDRVWDLAARLFTMPDDLSYKKCIDCAEKLMVEFEATYNKEGE